MNKMTLPYHFQWSTTHPHIAWVDLYNNGVLIEVAVVALDEKNGDLYFIPIAALDNVDRARLTLIIEKRDAHKYPRWDLMSTTTLKNGVNALEYFNQLVKVRSVSGQIFSPGSGKIGASGPLTARPNTSVPLDQQINDNIVYQDQVQNHDVPQQEHRKGPGRPPAIKK